VRRQRGQTARLGWRERCQEGLGSGVAFVARKKQARVPKNSGLSRFYLKPQLLRRSSYELTDTRF
jgi:hypothetical protein